MYTEGAIIRYYGQKGASGLGVANILKTIFIMDESTTFQTAVLRRLKYIFHEYS